MLINNANDCIEFVKIIQKKFMDRNLSLSTAESCTSGLLAALLTSQGGSSGFFLGGVNVYTNASKVKLLGVLPESLNKFGAVSDQVVREMSLGALECFHSDYSIAITGIAGPGGGVPDKPVGTIFLSIASAKNVWSHKYELGPDRLQNRSVICLNALSELIKFIETY